MEYLGQKARLIFSVCKTPKKYTEILRETGLSDRGLRIALKKFLQEGLIEKLPDGRYVLTEEGKKVAEELEVHELVQKILSSHDAKELKASLMLAVELDRAPRVATVINLLKILMYIRYRHYNSDIILPDSIVPRLNYLISITEKYLQELGVNPYRYSPDLKEFSEKLDMNKKPKPLDTSLSCDKISAFLSKKGDIEYNIWKIEKKVKEIKSYIDFVETLSNSIQLDTLTPEEKRLATNVSQIVEEYKRVAKDLIKKYRGERRKCKKKLEEILNIEKNLKTRKDKNTDENYEYNSILKPLIEEEKEPSKNLSEASFEEDYWW